MTVASLPNEILSLIFMFIPDTASLKQVIGSSQHFRRLAEPLLYRDVVFKNSRTYENGISRINDYRDLFCRKVSENDGRLARCVRSIFVHGLISVEPILPLLVNLRRLALTNDYFQSSDQQILHVTQMNLTHLHWSRFDEAGRRQLLDVLQVQTMIEHLVIIINPHDSLNKLKPSFIVPQLPSLKTLVTSSAMAARFLPMCNLNTLILRGDLQVGSWAPSRTFDTVTALSCNMGSKIERYLESFPNLECLVCRAVIPHLGWRRFLTSILPKLRFHGLRYLAFQIRGSPDIQTFIDSLDAVPQALVLSQMKKLRTLDLVCYEPKPVTCVRFCVEDGVAALPISFRRELAHGRRWFEWWQFHQFGPVEGDITFGRSSVYPGFL